MLKVCTTSYQFVSVHIDSIVCPCVYWWKTKRFGMYTWGRLPNVTSRKHNFPWRSQEVQWSNSTIQCVCEHDASIACKDGLVRCISRTSGLDAIYDVILNWIRFGLASAPHSFAYTEFPCWGTYHCGNPEVSNVHDSVSWTHPDVEMHCSSPVLPENISVYGNFGNYVEFDNWCCRGSLLPQRMDRSQLNKQIAPQGGV